jgi:thiamine biosynthesis lipoprotein
VKRRDFVVAAGRAAAGVWLAAPRVRLRLPRDEVPVERWSWAMGQAVHLVVYAGSEQEGLDACAAALAELRRVEQRLTLFDDASELSELNRRAGGRSLRVSRDLAAVLAHAERLRRATGGAFNVAVEPLMRAWGFHLPRRAAPTPAELAAAREAVASAVVELAGGVVRLPNAHTRLDFGGIGVGYGIDRALAVLRARGIARAFLDVSGDVGALGAPPGESGWLVGIADPRGPGGVLATVSLRDAALATSANTVAVVRYGALRAGHVMDPATGWPARALVQASVAARRAVDADALATAMLVMGRPPPGAGATWAVPAARG